MLQTCRGYVLFCWEDSLGCSILSFSAWLGAGIVGFVYGHYIVYSSSVRGLGPDKVCWKLAMNRGFEVWGFYLSLYPPTIISFPSKMVWQLRVPPRVAFFSWSASLGKILTMDNLWKSCIIVLDCGESVDHLLLHCSIEYELWYLVFCLFGIRLLSCSSLGRVSSGDIAI